MSYRGLGQGVLFLLVLVFFETTHSRALGQNTAAQAKQEKTAVLVEGLLADLPTGTLYSLDPYPKLDLPRGRQFQGYPILGQWPLALTHERREVYKVFLKSIRNNPRGDVAECFMPRHGLRIQISGGRVDFLICYQCLTVRMIQDHAHEEFAIDKGGGVFFNAFLKKRGVPLSHL
ncbi:MAG: hypothetical protein SFU85_03730 [Candidatus Methylacidiphilales bacterium]|nr:hypothetical protein [Candidatus Methylacidiphilales bacterium]